MDARPPELSRPRVLYLTHRVPHPPDKGDRIRNFHVLRHLSDRARVWLLSLADEPVAESTRNVLSSFCERVAVVQISPLRRALGSGLSGLRGDSLSEGAFQSSEARRTLSDWAAEAGFAAALASSGALAPYLRQLRGIPDVVDLVDVDSQKFLDFATATHGPKRWLYQFEGTRLRKLERRLPEQVQAVTVVSDPERAVYESFAGRAIVATNGVDLEYFRPTPNPAEEPACVFVGAMDYRPNVDAVEWFAHAVWPAIRTSNPTAVFHIVGRNPTAAVRRLGERPGVRVIGSVSDVRPHVAKAAVVVAPLRLGRGLQNKVLEALAMGKAVIASPAALAALRVQPGIHLQSAQAPDEWVDQIRELLGSTGRRRAMGEAGRKFVETHHHWDRCLQPLLDAVVPVVFTARTGPATMSAVP